MWPEKYLLPHLNPRVQLGRKNRSRKGSWQGICWHHWFAWLHQGCWWACLWWKQRSYQGESRRFFFTSLLMLGVHRNSNTKKLIFVTHPHSSWLSPNPSLELELFVLALLSWASGTPMPRRSSSPILPGVTISQFSVTLVCRLRSTVTLTSQPMDWTLVVWSMISRFVTRR